MHCVFSKCPWKVYNIEVLYGFLYLKSQSRVEIQVELNVIYGEQSPQLPRTKHWFNEYKAVRTSVVDMKKSGRPCDINEKITSKLKEFIQNERRITVRKLADYNVAVWICKLWSMFVNACCIISSRWMRHHYLYTFLIQKEWKLPGETSSKKMKVSTAHKKALMLSILWDANGAILMDFAESWVRINREYYVNLVQQAKKLRRKSRVCVVYYTGQ